METIKIDSLEKFIELVTTGEFGCGHVVFRGVTDTKNHKLIPSLGRIDETILCGLSIAEYERETLNRFKSLS